MGQFLSDFANGAVDLLGGAIGNLFLGFFQAFVNFICSLLISCLAVIADIFMQAMAITPTDIETWLGPVLTTGSFAYIITISGLLIAFLFGIWELCRGLVASIQGENPPIRPGVVLIRVIVYGSWSYAGIWFGKKIFDIGSRIYASVPFGTYNVTFSSGIGNAFTILSTSLSTWIGGTDENWAVALVGRIMATLLIVFSMMGFLKLLFTCTQRYVNMIFYTYFAPLAIGCGVSSSWSKVTWTWLKTMLSTLVLWVLDIWCIFGGMNLLNASINAMSQQDQVLSAMSCLLVTYGFMKGAIALDGIMSQFGATVTKTTGSLMGDMRDLMVTSHFASGAANMVGKGANKLFGNMKEGFGSALTRGGGIGADEFKNLPLKDINKGEARSVGQMAKDVALGTLLGFGPVRAAVGAANKGVGFVKGLKSLAAENREYREGREKVNAVRGFGRLSGEYRSGVGGATKGNLPASNTKSGQEYNAKMQKLSDTYAQKGIGQESLENDPAVMKDLEDNMLFDKNNPSLGTMKQNGFECQTCHIGQNGDISASFAKYDENGNLMEQRDVSQIQYNDAPKDAVNGKAEGIKGLNNGFIAGKMQQLRGGGAGTYTGNATKLSIAEQNGGNAYRVSGTDMKGHSVDKALSATKAQSPDGTQAVMVTSFDKNGTPQKQEGMVLQSGKTLRQGAEAIASGNLASAFVSRKDAATGKMEPVVNEMKSDPNARVTSSAYRTLSDNSGPISFGGQTIGLQDDSGSYLVRASEPDKNGMVNLVGVDAKDPTTVVSNVGQISNRKLEKAYAEGPDALNKAIGTAFANANPPQTESAGTAEPAAAPTTATTAESVPTPTPAPTPAASVQTVTAEPAQTVAAEPAPAPVQVENPATATAEAAPVSTASQTVVSAQNTQTAEVESPASGTEHTEERKVTNTERVVTSTETTSETAQSEDKASGHKHGLAELLDGQDEPSVDSEHEQAAEESDRAADAARKAARDHKDNGRGNFGKKGRDHNFYRR